MTIGPPWFEWMKKEIGQHELPENRGPVIERYIRLGKCGSVGDPWCAIFMNAALEETGLRGTRSPSSQSFRYDKNFTALTGPALGAICIFWRINRKSGFGHVGAYCSETPGYIETLGGNEHDAVRRELLARNAATFGLVGYFWPINYPRPTIERIPYHASAAAAIGGKVT